MSRPIVAIHPEYLKYSHLNTERSIDTVIRDMNQHPEVIEFLKDSNLGTEYLTIEYNHGCDVYITVHK